MAVRQEVRIALVLYGGSSLAIYINGVAQELLRLVRGTAPSDDPAAPSRPLLRNKQLKGSELVYRKLGQLLPRARVSAGLPPDEAPIRTRFIVDILSGSSAGGINGIFLAKALANEQSIDELKTLWVEEGDIGLLINDKESARGLPGVSVATPPRSLLNGQRMYWKLLHALDGMEGADDGDVAGGPRSGSRLVDELDLYVTTTDLHGLVLPITLSDKVIHEPHHRAVFHFKYAASSPGEAGQEADGRNDFTWKYNPFLAFAARCTSSLPFVFEPMTLGDIDAIVQRTDRHGADPGARSGSERWRPFYRDYLMERIESDRTEPPDPKPKEERIREFTRRPFGDGGALDNAPFSHTTATLARRGAEVPVDRKLFYVEPDPAIYDPDAPLADPPDAIANSLMQGITLPRKETIREDLDRIVERNQHLGRIDRVLRDLREDVGLALGDGPRLRRREAIEGMFLNELLPRYGVAYGAYQRLRVGEVSVHLAALFARLLDLAEDSADAASIGYLGRAWRDRHYSHYREDGKESFAAFLVRLDLTFTLRRLSFLRSKLDDLFDAEDPGEILARRGIDLGPEEELDPALRHASEALNKAYAAARKTGRDLRRPRSGNPVWEALHQGGFADDIIAMVKELREDATDPEHRRMTDAERRRIAESAAERLDGRLSAAIEVLAAEIKTGVDRAEELMAPALRGGGSEDENGSAADAVRGYLGMLFAEFIEYDMLAFPLMYGTDAGRPTRSR